MESQPVEVCPHTIGYKFDGFVAVQDSFGESSTTAKVSCSGQECLNEMETEKWIPLLLST